MNNTLSCTNCNKPYQSSTLKVQTEVEHQQKSNESKSEETKQESHIANLITDDTNTNAANDNGWICELCSPCNLDAPDTGKTSQDSDISHKGQINKEVEIYLKKNKYSIADAKLLTGGFTNYSYRISSAGAESKILKHAEAFPSVIEPSLALDVTRMDLEHFAMTALQGKLHSSCRVPAVYDYDPETHCLVMQDCGNQTLKKFEANEATIKGIGESLGAWLFSLHNCGQDIPKDGSIKSAALYRYATYSRLVNIAEKYSLDKTFFIAIDEKYGQKIMTDQQCLCHGDFWSGNVIVNDEGLCSIVDWEIVRKGSGATDVGQFVAEAYLLHRSRGDSGTLLKSFLESYMTKAKPSQDFVKDALVHLGVHLFYWPNFVPWGTNEYIKEIAFLGAEIMKQADNENWTYFVNGPFGAFFSNMVL